MGDLDAKRDLTRLQAVLDTHGANPARWPVADALRLAEFARSDFSGRAMLAQAAALDELLAAAPMGAGLDGITDRIMSRVAGGLPGEAKVVALPLRQRRVARPATWRVGAVWPVFGALAAALIIGFYVGNAGLVAPALQQVAGISFDEADLAPLDAAQEGEVL